MAQSVHALKQNNFGSTQARYDEYEIQSISLYENLHDFSNREMSFYKQLNAFLPTIQKKKEYFLDNEAQLRQNIHAYNLLLYACSNNENEMKNLDIDISIAIHLIWRVHLLSTTQYYIDCMEHFTRVINYKPNNVSTSQIDVEQFKNILSSMINADNKHIHDTSIMNIPKMNVLSIDFNIFKQMLYEYCAFITDFGQYQQHSNAFDLDKAMIRYRYFMYLKYISNDNRCNLHLIPTGDVRLLWHSHIIYNASKYIKFSTQLFGKTSMLKYDFVCIQNRQKQDIEHTETLWEMYFGVSSYRDYTFNDFPLRDNYALNAMNIKAQVRKKRNDEKERGFFYYGRNRACALCIGVIGFEIVAIVFCLYLYIKQISMIAILIIFVGATLLVLILAMFLKNQRCGYTDQDDLENLKIDEMVQNYVNPINYSEEDAYVDDL